MPCHSWHGTEETYEPETYEPETYEPVPAPCARAEHYRGALSLFSVCVCVFVCVCVCNIYINVCVCVYGPPTSRQWGKFRRSAQEREEVEIFALHLDEMRLVLWQQAAQKKKRHTRV